MLCHSKSGQTTTFSGRFNDICERRRLKYVRSSGVTSEHHQQLLGKLKLWGGATMQLVFCIRINRWAAACNVWTIILNDWTLPSSIGVVLFWKCSMRQVKGCLPNTMNPFQNIGSTLFAEYKRRIIQGKINSFKTVCVWIRLYTWKTAKTHFVSMTQLASSLWYKVRHLHFRHAHKISVGT